MDDGLPRIHVKSTITFAYVNDPRPDRAGDRKVSTTSYVHTLAEDDQISQEFAGWHWHPANTPSMEIPHLHIGRRSDWIAHPVYSFPKLHMPTARVAFEEILLFAFRDLKVRPANGRSRDDCIDQLRRSLALFKAYCTWS